MGFDDGHFLFLFFRWLQIRFVFATFVIFLRLRRTDIDRHVNDSYRTLSIKKFECIFRVIFVVHYQKFKLPQRLALSLPLNFNDIDDALIKHMVTLLSLRSSLPGILNYTF